MYVVVEIHVKSVQIQPTQNQHVEARNEGLEDDLFFLNGVMFRFHVCFFGGVYIRLHKHKMFQLSWHTQTIRQVIFCHGISCLSCSGMMNQMSIFLNLRLCELKELCHKGLA